MKLKCWSRYQPISNKAARYLPLTESPEHPTVQLEIRRQLHCHRRIAPSKPNMRTDPALAFSAQSSQVLYSKIAKARDPRCCSISMHRNHLGHTVSRAATICHQSHSVKACLILELRGFRVCVMDLHELRGGHARGRFRQKEDPIGCCATSGVQGCDWVVVNEVSAHGSIDEEGRGAGPCLALFSSPAKMGWYFARAGYLISSRVDLILPLQSSPARPYRLFHRLTSAVLLDHGQ